MPLVEAFLALALTMLSLAMVATLLVEGLHRLTRTRSKDLRAMLETLYENSELREIAKEELGNSADQHKKEFVDNVLSNPLLKGVPIGIRAKMKANLRPLIHLSTEDFFKRLAETDIGKSIKLKTEEEIDEIVDSLSRSYDGLGVAATDLFKRRAQLISFAAGIVLAVFLNINALALLQKYLSDPLETSRIVAQAQAIQDQFESNDRNTELKGFLSREDAEDYFKLVKNEIDGLDQVGVAAAWNSNKLPRRLWNRQEDVGNALNIILEFLLWALGVIGTGMLIGLGGPFWFNVARKLTAVLQVMRGDIATPASASVTTAQSAVVASVNADPMQANKDALKMTGGAPLLVKAKARVLAANAAAIESDLAFNAAADALKAADDLKAIDPNGVEVAKKALEDAKATKEWCYDLKKKAVESMKSTS